MIDRTQSGVRCHIRHPVRTVQGELPRDSQGTVVYEIDNSGRHLMLVHWDNGIRVHVFPGEIECKGALTLPAQYPAEMEVEAIMDMLHHKSYEDNARDSTLDRSSVPNETPEAASAEMSVVEHLEELRRRLFVCVVAVGIGAVVAGIFYQPILQCLLSPLPSKASVLATHSGKLQLAVTGIGERVSVVVKLALAVGLSLVTPVWLSQLWGFLAPGLRRHEKHYALPFTVVGVALFLAGLGVGFLTLRYTMDWLLGFGTPYFIEACV
jgi:hypothetical protein